MAYTTEQLLEISRAMPQGGYSTQQLQKLAGLSQTVTPQQTNTPLKQLSIQSATGQLDTSNQEAVTQAYQRAGGTPTPPKPVDPILSLSPEQRAEFSKQFSIALSKGQVSDQASVDAFKAQFAQGTQGGYTPTLASTQAQAYGTPTGTSATMQNQLGGASNSSSPYYPRYNQSEQQASDYLNTFEKPKTEEEILAEKTKNAQAEIDAVNRYYESLLVDQSRVNDTREREANAQSVLQGLSGSTEAGARKVQAENISAGENAKIQAQRAAQIQGIYRQIQTEAYNAAQDARKNARESATGILNMASARTEKERADILAKQQKGIENAKLLASSGVDLASLAQKDPTTYQYLVDSAGGLPYLSALFTLNRPQEDVLDKKIEGGKYVIAYKNPLTGSVRVETVDLGLPVGYSKTVDAGDRILAIPDNWDGDPAGLITINKGLTPQQSQKLTGVGGTNIEISDAAKVILEQVNRGEDINKLIPGSSNAAQKLRNEVLAGLAAQGGMTTQTENIVNEGYNIVKSMLDQEKYKDLGGYSSILGGQFSTSYGDAMAMAEQLTAILARDNLGLLKGAMSDKDIAFIKSMSSGFEGQGTKSETYVKTQLESIKTKLEKKLGAKEDKGAIPKGTDGEAYGYPGYVSDGTQWVLKNG